MATFMEVLGRAGVSVPDELLAEVEVPVLSGSQRQGDVSVWPCDRLSSSARGGLVPAVGVAVVRGEATGNTHLLQPDPGSRVWWAPESQDKESVVLGVVTVEGVGWLIHSEEHGANGLAAGSYVLRGKREQADVIRRVAD